MPGCYTLLQLEAQELVVQLLRLHLILMESLNVDLRYDPLVYSALHLGQTLKMQRHLAMHVFVNAYLQPPHLRHVSAYVDCAKLQQSWACLNLVSEHCMHSKCACGPLDQWKSTTPCPAVLHDIVDPSRQESPFPLSMCNAGHPTGAGCNRGSVESKASVRVPVKWWR